MILKYTLILSVILFSGCSNLNTKTQIILDKSLQQADKDILEIAVNLQGIAAEDVWPGFSNFRTSVVYFTANEQFLLNPTGQVPREYLSTNIQGPSWSNRVYIAKNWTSPEGTTYTKDEVNSVYLASAFSSEQTNNHFSYSVFFLDSMERFHFKDMKWSFDEWIAIFWHEVFHNYQDLLFKPELITNDITNFHNVQTYVMSEKYLIGIKKELKLISTALKSKEIEKKYNILCKQFIPMRLKRYKTMPAKAVSSEQFYEISEGTARYVEELMSLKAGELLKKEQNRSNFLVSNFNFFEKYSSRKLEYYYESIMDVSPQKRYFYNTGFSLALLLDQLNPNWKVSAFKERGFLFSKVYSLCQK